MLEYGGAQIFTREFLAIVLDLVDKTYTLYSFIALKYSQSLRFTFI